MILDYSKIQLLVFDYDSFEESVAERLLNLIPETSVTTTILTRKDLEKDKFHNNTNVIKIDYPLVFIPDEVIKNLFAIELKVQTVAVISTELSTLKSLYRLPWRTIFYSPNYEFSEDEVGYLPDYVISGPNTFADLLDNSIVGFFAEWIVYRNFNDVEYKKRYVNSIKYSYAVDLNTCEIFGGGRYFRKQDKRRITSYLSSLILKLKNDNKEADGIVAEIFSFCIDKILECEVDGITRVPPRPSEKFDRFKLIINKLCEKHSLINYSDNLSAKRDFLSQKQFSARERELNVKGAFKCHGDLKNKHIVLIDDIITTGETVKECCRELFNCGANKVTILALGVNQREITNFIDIFKFPTCDECEKILNIKFNMKSKETFWGCSTRVNDKWCKGKTLNNDKWIQKIELNNEPEKNIDCEDIVF